MAAPNNLAAEVKEAAADAARGTKERDAARRVEALSLRIAGMSYEQIGQRLGIGPTAAEQMINRALERAEARNVQSMRELENERLDRAQLAIWGDVTKGDLKAITTFLAISSQRSKINGLYAPTQVQMSLSIRKDMEDALAGLEALVLHERPNPHHEPKVLEARDVTGLGDSPSDF